ncbi:hypothetical protein, partial [Trueperella pyogenes]
TRPASESASVPAAHEPQIPAPDNNSDLILTRNKAGTQGEHFNRASDALPAPVGLPTHEG